MTELTELRNFGRLGKKASADGDIGGYHGILLDGFQGAIDVFDEGSVTDGVSGDGENFVGGGFV